MFDIFQRRLAELLIAEVKCNGVHFATGNPPEFLVTAHAEMRLKERVNIGQKEEMESFVIKAWFNGTHKKPDWCHSSDTNCPDKPPNSNKKLEFRVYKDICFIFAVAYNPKYFCHQKHLITVITEKTKRQ